ncbi:MAG: Appr-1-p processing protein, partial [Fimbriimonadales bacterium]
MIQWIAGDYWESAEAVDALVNTVNTEGVMGKGLALEFK